MLINSLLDNAAISSIAKIAGGIAADREIPRFAPARFRDLFEGRPNYGNPKSILLWPDTFSVHFRP